MRPILTPALALLPVVAQAQLHTLMATQVPLTAPENGTITAPAAGHVWYGAKQSWISQPVVAGQQVPCTNRWFGRDPLPGVVKLCRFSPHANTPPACWPSTLGGDPKVCGPLRWDWSFDLSTMSLTAWAGWRTGPATATTAYALVCKGPGCLPGAEILPPDHPSVAALHAQAVLKIIEAK